MIEVMSKDPGKSIGGDQKDKYRMMIVSEPAQLVGVLHAYLVLCFP